MVILLVNVETHRPSFLHLASLQDSVGLEASATSGWPRAHMSALAYQKSVFAELDTAFVDPAAGSTVRKARS